MKPVFADTFYWYALANPREQWHLAAMKARAALGQRHDKAYSLVDCVSMTTCHKYGITEILTHDHHFTQEGFVILIAQ